MVRWLQVALLVCLLGGSLPAAPAAAAPENGSVRLTAVSPNTVADGDAGESVTLRVEGSARLGRYSLGDGETTVELPETAAEGRVTLSVTPSRVANRTGHRVVGVPDFPRLANGGERIVLRRNGTVVDSVSYTDAPEGERGRLRDGRLDWRLSGATDFPVVTGGREQVRAFVLPDGAGVPAGTLRGAEDRVLLAGYTLTSRRVVAALVAASTRGVPVRVLVDGNPVGGMTRREAALLDRLVAAGVEVTVVGGERAPYAFHHAKYAVVDDSAVVTTENWKPAGTGGRASRGWGVVVNGSRTVRALAATYAADASGPGAVPWERFRSNRSFEPARTPPANGSFPTRVEPAEVAVDRVEVVRAPDNAEARVVSLLDNATESVRVQQVSIGGRRQPFNRATVRAARRGVEVQVLLSSAWYVREENEAAVERLNRLGDRENIPLSARLADPNGRFEKVHAKGVVVDGERVLVGSLNWNNHSARQNREVALVLHGAAAGDYYGGVFRRDWRGGRWRLTVGVAVVTLAAAVGALLVGRRVEFEGERGEP